MSEECKDDPTQVTNLDGYSSVTRQLKEIQTVAIMPTGRTGSDYLQSLVENHPEVLSSNGHFGVYEQFFDVSSTLKINHLSNKDIAHEFVGLFLYKLVSKYAVQGRKDRLGIEYFDSRLLPTWAGLSWNGDRLGTKVPSNSWSKDGTNNNWQEELSRRDQWFLKCLLGRNLRLCGYLELSPGKVQLGVAAIYALIPMSMEWRYLSPKYVWSRATSNRKGLVQVLETPLFYLRRVKICLSSLKNEFLNRDPSFPLIRVP